MGEHLPVLLQLDLPPLTRASILTRTDPSSGCASGSRVRDVNDTSGSSNHVLHLLSPASYIENQSFETETEYVFFSNLKYNDI